jgi:hypothetical protein
MTAIKRLGMSLLIGCLGLMALGAIAASATSRVTRDTGGARILVQEKEPGINDIEVGVATNFPDDYRITDQSNILNPLPAFCVRESDTSIRCNHSSAEPPAFTPAEVSTITVDLGAGDDEFAVSSGGIPSNVTLNVYGGDGNDRIIGRNSSGKEVLDGGAGNDIIFVGTPSEGKVATGGPGNDIVGIGISVTRSFLARTAPALAAKGNPGATLLGDVGADRLTGGPENDKLKGGPGRDRIKGRGGNDIIDCGAGKGDVGIGGPGRDLGRRCEKVKH